MGSIEHQVAASIIALQESSRTKFLREHERDEEVMALSVSAMNSTVSLTCAVHRLAGSLAFPHLIADLVAARRGRRTDEANRICAEIMWQVEEEVVAQCRREVNARHPK